MNREEDRETQIARSEEEKQELVNELKKAGSKPRLNYSYRDTRKIPRKQPGDGYVVGGALIGFFVGGALLGYFSIYIDFMGVFTGIIFGILAGALAGTYIGGFIKKRVNRKKQKLESHYDAISKNT